MAVLSEIVRNVLVIIIMASFLELLLPDGQVKPFVRFSIGLFILISILNPTLNILYSDKNLPIDLWTYMQEPVLEGNILESGAKINEQIVKSGEDIYKSKLEGQISAVAMLVPGVEGVETKADLADNGLLTGLYIVVRPEVIAVEDNLGKIGVFSNQPSDYSKEEQDVIAKKLSNVVENMYGLKGAQIQIEFEGG